MRFFSQILLLCLLGLGVTFFAKADTTDNYQIYIKGILFRTERKFTSAAKGLPYIVFNKANYADTIEIKYNHCTSGETKRQIKIMDLEGNVLLEWDFPDKITKETMSLPVKEIWGSPHLKNRTYYKLCYFDNMTEKGVTLTLMALRDKKVNL
jgi:hypothetical protein